MKKFLLLPTVVVFVSFVLYFTFTPTRKEKPEFFHRAIATITVTDPTEERDTNKASDVYLLLEDYSLVPLKTSQQWDESRAVLNPSNNLVAVEESIDSFKEFQIVVGDGVTWRVICTNCYSAVWVSETELTYSTRFHNYYKPKKGDYLGLYNQQVLTGEVERIDDEHWAAKKRRQKLDANSDPPEGTMLSSDLKCGFVGTVQVRGVSIATQNPRMFCGQPGPIVYYLIINGTFVEQERHVVNIGDVE